MYNSNKAPSTRIRFHRKRYRFQWKRNDCIAYTYRFRIVFILFSLETVFKSYRFQSFSCWCKVKTQRKVFGFDENDMKTYSCTRDLKFTSKTERFIVLTQSQVWLWTSHEPFKSEDRLSFNLISCWDFKLYLHNFSALFSQPGRLAQGRKWHSPFLNAEKGTEIWSQ